MARPKGSKNKPKADADAKTAVNGNGGIGHNSELTDDQKQALALHHKAAYEAKLAAKKKADAEFKNACKLAKAEIAWTDGVALIKDMILAETEEGEADLRARMNRALLAARYMAVPLGSQFEMFDEDRTPAIDRARAEGRRDGMADKPLANPYDPSVPQADAYADGWHEGRKARAEAQRKRDGALFDGAGKESPEEKAALEDVERQGIAGAGATFEVRP